MHMESERGYVYTLVKENFRTGERSKRRRKYYSFSKRLEVGGLYVHLGKGYPGCYRVLSVELDHDPVFYASENA